MSRRHIATRVVIAFGKAVFALLCFFMYVLGACACCVGALYAHIDARATDFLFCCLGVVVFSFLIAELTCKHIPKGRP